MKIKNKISLSIIFLLTVLVVNTIIGLTLLSRVSDELSDVAQKDIALTEIVTTVTQHQLEKGILFERMIRVAEELAYDEVSDGRKEHLLASAQMTEGGFVKLANGGAAKIIEGKELIAVGAREALDPTTRREYVDAQTHLENIEKAHIKYDGLIRQIFSFIKEGKYELSFEDLNKVQRDQTQLSRELKNLLSEVRRFTSNSLERANKQDQLAHSILWGSICVSVLVSIVLVLLIIKSITSPLKRLEQAANQIGEGNFVVDIKRTTNDEIAEVSEAFNVMSKKLQEARDELERKNKDLATSLKTTEEQKQDLQKVNKELDRFVYTISHDIRSPLMGISGFASILNDHYKDNVDERAARCISGVRRGADLLGAMLEDLLALTRLSRIKNPFEEVDMNELMSTVIARVEFRISESQATVNVQKDLPAIVCDRVKMGEVLLNLINNGIKFASKNVKSKPIVDISYEETPEGHQFAIKDNGIGISPEDQKDVFEIFKRLESAREFEGTGAGLTIVKGIIDDHQGRIWIESELGAGATFLFVIPKNLKSA